MPRRFSRVARVPSSPRRLTTWFEFQWFQQTLTAEGGSIFFSLNAAALGLVPFTIVRSHFMIHVQSDQAAAVEEFFGAVGIAVVSTEAVAVGVTAVPTPITEMGSALWFVHQMYGGAQRTAADKSGVLISIDSKAMRKVEAGQDIVVVGELDNQGAGHILGIGGRMLIKNN